MVVENALVWGIKSAWVDYVDRMKDGLVTTSGGATRLATGEFVFPLANVTDQAAGFTGCVEFVGHFGMLSVRFSNPTVTIVDRTVELSIADDDPVALDQRRTILTLGSGTRSTGMWRFDSPVLTQPGADLFFDNYRPGTRFDPIVIPAHAIVVDGQRLNSLEEV